MEDNTQQTAPGVEAVNFVFAKNWAMMAKKLKNPKTRLAFFDVIVDYGAYGIEPEFTEETDPLGVMAAMFEGIKLYVDTAKQRYNNCVENGRKGAAHGKKGGAPKGNRNAAKQPQEQPLNKNKNKNNNITLPINRERQDAPALDEIKNYVVSKGYTFSPEDFYNYYLARNWHVDGQPLKNWQVMADLWQRRQSQFSPTPRPGTMAGRTETAATSPKDYQTKI